MVPSDRVSAGSHPSSRRAGCGGQADDHARDAEIAELVQPIEILGDAEQCDWERCGIAPRFGRELVELRQRGGYVGTAGAASAGDPAVAIAHCTARAVREGAADDEWRIGLLHR